MSTIAEMMAALAGPGMDPRQWISFGLVNDGEKSVIFTDDDGKVSPVGPIVTVTLEPSGIVVPCRVASSCAGNEEGEWFPFMPRDEVLVAIPEGDERAGCTIIGRLNQSIDTFPLRVAGQDVTKNNFGFKRLRTPYIIETASSFMIRSAITGAGITIDQTGNCYWVSGDGHRIVMHGSFLKLESGGGKDFFQIDPEEHEVLIQAAGSTQFAMNSGKSSFFTKGTFNFGTSGMAGTGHAITVEQVAVILQAIAIGLSAFSAPGALAALSTPAASAALVNAALGVASGLPIALLLPAITAGLAVPVDPFGAKPGIGRAGFML